ncbi:MAG: type IVB secretion system coupling complex protein DotM/IcmP [Gammaproteobacteria bacterium]
MAGGGAQPNQSDNSMGILWVIAAIFIVAAIIWVSFKKVLVSIYFHIKLVEISILSPFTSRLEDTRVSILNALASTDPNAVSFDLVVKIGQAVGDYLRYPFVLVLVILAFVIFLTSSTRIFKRIYSMRDLVHLEQTNWPQIIPVAKLDLVKTDIDKGPWAMALSPMQFCKRHNLLQEFKRAPQEGMSHKDWNKVEVSLKRGEANKIFSIQLGPMWPGLNRVPPHVKALFAAFAARLNGDGKAAADLFAQINNSAVTKLNFAGVDELSKKYEDTKLVKKVVESHAYLLTVMAEMLKAARSDGVQASADFLWLKPVDRRLWYMLNTVGRQTPFSEVAGPFAHWVAENEIGRRLLVPMVEEATNALERALKEILYKADEPPDEKK